MTENQTNQFYLGRIFDPVQRKLTDHSLTYDSADLTTHGVVVGMTGSGKTGLCIAMLEEAALAGIPAILIDPKGDLTNLLLHFPRLAPEDFQPWVDADTARRLGKTVQTAAQDASASWRQGLAEWGITPDRVAALAQAVNYTIYTPGSDAGEMVSILASLACPAIPWEGNREVLREKISSTVTALLSVVGFEAVDPVRSREHILLSNIFEFAWSQKKDLDLSELILQTQTPPFPKLGVFPVETFFPEKDRFDLAMRLNNFLAAPAFQSWLEGQPLDIASLLYRSDQKPRHSVFYMSHLSDAERMFFTTLLFSSVETWMRTQSGTSGLRALVYFDEIAGYLPPVNNPPSKPVILRMLKQARAYGVGLLLASQNPVDFDYKALANAGTWMIGKLQTEQDKERLLDGLSGAGSNLDRGQYSQLISGLEKRQFLLHNVHQDQPVIFQSRWTMNYLAGPMTRAQIPALNNLAKQSTLIKGAPSVFQTTTGQVAPVTIAVPAAATAASDKPASISSATRPTVPSGIYEYFMPYDVTFSQALQTAKQVLPAGAPAPLYLYRPALIAQTRVRYLDRRYNLDSEQVRTALVRTLDRRGIVHWDTTPFRPLDAQKVQAEGLSMARYASLDAPFSDAKVLANLQKDYQDWSYRTSTLHLKVNTSLKIFGVSDSTTGEFRDRCSEAARAGRDGELAKVNASFDSKESALNDKLIRLNQQLRQDQEQVDGRKREELGKDVENIVNLFSKRRTSVSSSLSKHRLTDGAKARMEVDQQAFTGLQGQLAEMERARQQAVKDVSDRWAGLVDDVSEIPITPSKKDIYLELFGVIWLPYYVIQLFTLIELAGFSI
jgi:Helicase HerA, central domain